MRIFLLKNRSERCSLRYGSDKLHSSYPVQGYVVNADIFIRLTKISGKKKNEEYQMGLNYEVGDKLVEKNTRDLKKFEKN